MKRIMHLAGLLVLALYLTGTLAFAAVNSNTNNIQEAPQSNLHQKPPVITPLNNAYINMLTPQSSETFDGRWTDHVLIKWEYGGFKNGKSLDGTFMKIVVYKDNIYNAVRTFDNVSVGAGGRGSFNWSFSDLEPVWGCQYLIMIQNKTYGDLFKGALIKIIYTVT